MIIDKPESKFIFIFNRMTATYGSSYTIHNGRSLTNGEVLKSWGKCLILGTRPWLDDLAKKLDPYVEDEIIPCIKYDRVPSKNLGIEECVMMAYCHIEKREEIWRIFSKFGSDYKAWVSEKETMGLWEPGGPIMERWLNTTNFDETTKDKIRDNARQRFDYLENHPNDVFKPLAQ